ncbi:MAG: tetratricopeptide repeat protein [Acidobacteriota bacterium]
MTWWRRMAVCAGLLLVTGVLCRADGSGAAPAGTAPPVTAVDAVFDAANRAYEQEDYEDAAIGYQRLIDAGVEDARVEYNLGNALYRLGKIGPAILAYERALKLSPSDRRIRDNLEQVSALRIDDVGADAADGSPLAVLWAWHGRLSPDLVTGLFIAIWVLFNVCLAVTVFAHRRHVRRVGGYALAVALVAVMAMAGILGPLIYRRDAIVRGIVVHARVDVRSAPNEAAGIVLTTVHEGLEVRVRDMRDRWLEVTLPNGIRGWVGRASVGIV